MAADILAVRPWWLEERRLMQACRLVKMAAECLSAGNSSQTEDAKKLESPAMLCWLSSPVAKVTDGGLKCFVCVNVKVSGLEFAASLLVIYDYEGSQLPSCLLLLSFGCHWGLDDLVYRHPRFWDG